MQIHKFRTAMYDGFMLTGAGLVIAGVAVMFGVGPALIAAGVSVIGLTYTGAGR